MKYSVAYSFEPGLIDRLAEYSGIYEVYGKPWDDEIGGGRSSYTLRKTSLHRFRDIIRACHRADIRFNYLLNGAHLGGLEQTARGHRKIRRILRRLDTIGVDSITVASPFLLRLIKEQFPRFSVRVSAFAMIDTAEKARQWERMGADALCLSALSCNYDFARLRAIRAAVSCELQLIANSSCLPNCAYEPTHMNLLTDSSRKGHALRGMCIDYCILNCARIRFSDPVNYVRSVWIRPEDTSIYEDLGIDSFKILERSCPPDLLERRVKAYTQRSFTGNLYELVGPVAKIKKEQGASLGERLRMIAMMFRPSLVKPSSLLKMKSFGEAIIPHSYAPDECYVTIDTSRLEGFCVGRGERDCSALDCAVCGFCNSYAQDAVRADGEKHRDLVHRAAELEKAVHTSRFWL
ncbi:MAG: U32 family peptidase [Fibrobacterota bacterium]